ncbi:erythromycin esterase family protein [Microbispora sp. ATCC PTA-5024]|uniref:erythromycin esterase family protein n=1 Tax=Microbispora sp. ATCC PTA-5024 TaxID=316330 RepID=UPI0009FD0940|nr:erythromycin esterase family protein [Microbispora sp. ATCC PTA-5024]
MGVSENVGALKVALVGLGVAAQVVYLPLLVRRRDIFQVSGGGVVELNEDVTRALAIPSGTIREVAQREARELARWERAYRGELPTPELRGKIVILVDDGLATGASMRAAIRAVREREPAQIVVAVPAAPESTCEDLSALVDDVVCATTPIPFFSMGESYWDFTQTADEEVRELLRAATSARTWAPPARTDLAVLRSELVPTRDGAPPDEVLFHIVGDARFVLIGEVTHGTSLHRSAEEVIAYFEKVDPVAAERARDRYSCFEHRDGDDGQAYGFAAAFGAGESCEQHVVDQLVDLQRRSLQYRRAQGLLGEEEFFYAEQNAKVVANAERYYRTMFGGRVSSWNLRDRHMADTLFALAEHLGWQRGEPAKIVVWAHNSHVGDARATEMGARGELNLGQLVREHNPEDCRLIGFTTYTGTVTAADDWGRPADRKNVRRALPDSVEELLRDVGHKEFLLDFVHSVGAADLLRKALLERAIGVVYRPGTERQSHYFQTRLSDQFDAVVHIDETRALEPLERTARWERGEAPETYPVAV